MTRSQRSLRPALALLLIPVAALSIILFFPHSARHTPPAEPPSAVLTPPVPVPERPDPPRILAGAPTQSGFTLLAATALSLNEGPMLPPSFQSTFGSAIVGNSSLLDAASAGVGLWIHVRGGLGFKTLSVPIDGLRHAYPFGNVSLTLQAIGNSAGYSPRWVRTGGKPLLGEMPPYSLWPYSRSGMSQPGEVEIALMPTSLLHLFRVNAQALTAQGKALGGPVTLRCAPYNANTLFIQIPAAYSAQTKQFRVTLARANGKSPAASWQIAHLPPSLKHGPDNLPLQPAVRVGPYLIEAGAAESKDTSGITDFFYQSPDSQPSPSHAGGPSPINVDAHYWTGLPTLRYRIHVRPVSTTSANESWLLQLNQVTPQWTLPLRPYTVTTPSAWEHLPDLFSLSTAYTRSLAAGWTIQDAEIGIAYPGQQHWLKFDGLALRSSLHTETVTFHNADVVHEAAFGGDRVVWRQPEAQTTPSGITFLVLNGQPGGRGTGAYPPPVSPSGYSPLWWYDRGNAELLLAWRLPPGMAQDVQASPDTPLVVEFPRGVLPLGAVVDNLRPPPLALKVSVPGAVDARALQQAGYSFLRLSTRLSGPVKYTHKPLVLRPGDKPEVLSPYSWREGPEILTAQPLPRHLKTLSLQITLRGRQEQHPFHLIVPVRAFPPPAWDPKPLGVPR